MKKKISDWLDHEEHLAWVILIPIVILLILFAYYPAIQSFGFSFQKYNIKMPMRTGFNGLKNYINVLQDPIFLKSLIKVSYILTIAPVMVIFVSITTALILNQKFYGVGVLRAVIILPWAVPPVVNGHLWKWIFNGDYGAFNGILSQLGIIEKYHFWLNDPVVALSIAAFIFTWRYAPFISILFLGVLQSIPSQLYEAAKVDGAGIFKQFIHVTLPSLYRVGGIALIMILIAAFTIFDDIYSLMQFDEATKTPMIYNYEVTFQMGRFGKGAAMAYLVGLFLFIMTAFYIRMSLKEDKYEK